MLSAVSGCSQDPACIQTAPLENNTWAEEKNEGGQREALPKDESQSRHGDGLEFCRTQSSKAGG